MYNIKNNFKEEKLAIILSIMFIVIYGLGLMKNPKMIYGLMAIPVLAIILAKPKSWIFIMAIYLPLETVILNFTPGSLVTIVRYGTEAFSYVVLIKVILDNVVARKKFYINKSDGMIFVFIGICIISGIINNVSLQIFILGLRWLIRYVVIYFIVRFTVWEKNHIRSIINLILGIGCFEVVLGILQVFFRSTLDKILLPRTLEVGIMEINVSQATSKYSIFGTLGRYGEYAYIITIIVLILMSKLLIENRNVRTKIFFIGSVVALVLSYARQAVIGVMFAIFIAIITKKNIKVNKKKILLSIFICGVIILLGVSTAETIQLGHGTTNEGIISRYLSIFTEDFISGDYSGHGRTYFLTTVNKIFLTTKPMFGYGVGMYGTRSAILYDSSVYNQLGIPIQFSMDVYWTSIIGQIGLLGLIVLISIYFIFYKEYKKLFIKSSDKFVRMISLAMLMIILAILFQSFFGSNLSDRYQAYYIWLFWGLLGHLKNVHREAK